MSIEIRVTRTETVIEPVVDYKVVGKNEDGTDKWDWVTSPPKPREKTSVIFTQTVQDVDIPAIIRVLNRKPRSKAS